MVTSDIHFSSWNGIPFYIVVYGFYVYHFSVSKIFLKLQCRLYVKLGYVSISRIVCNITQLYI